MAGNYLLIVLLGAWQDAVGGGAAPLIRLTRAWFQAGGEKSREEMGKRMRQEKLEERN